MAGERHGRGMGMAGYVSINHDEFYWSTRYMLHVSALLTIRMPLND
jgi:hypothetical protein